MYQGQWGCHAAALQDQRLRGFDGTRLQLQDPAADAHRSVDLGHPEAVIS